MSHTIRNLGKVLTILATADVREAVLHADVDAFGAPRECHALVSRGQDRRMRQARKHAEAIARAPLHVIMRQARRRGYSSIRHRHEERLLAVLHAKLNPFL